MERSWMLLPSSLVGGSNLSSAAQYSFSLQVCRMSTTCLANNCTAFFVVSSVCWMCKVTGSIWFITLARSLLANFGFEVSSVKNDHVRVKSMSSHIDGYSGTPLSGHHWDHCCMSAKYGGICNSEASRCTWVVEHNEATFSDFSVAVQWRKRLATMSDSANIMRGLRIHQQWHTTLQKQLTSIIKWILYSYSLDWGTCPLYRISRCL